MNVAAVVLAAGASSRLGEPKQLLRDHNDEALVHKVAREALAAGAQPVIVVVGAAKDEVRDVLSDLQVTTVVNIHWSEGLASSIRAGVREAANADALLLLTCDMPSVGIPHLTMMMESLHAGAVRVASSYDYTRGIPAIIRREEFAALEALSGDRGAKALLMQKDTALVSLANGSFDLDTRENVAAWRAAGST